MTTGETSELALLSVTGHPCAALLFPLSPPARSSHHRQR